MRLKDAQIRLLKLSVKPHKLFDGGDLHSRHRQANIGVIVSALEVKTKCYPSDV